MVIFAATVKPTAESASIPKPKINLEEGIKDVIKWIVEYREFLKDESFKFELKA